MKIEFKLTPLTLTQAVMLLLVAVSVLVAFQVAAASVDINSLPAAFQTPWQAVVIFFSSGAVIAAFAFLRNILGYIENKLDNSSDAAIQYEASQLGATLVRFTVYVAALETLLRTLFIGTQYEPYAIVLAGAIGVVFDIVLKAINDLSKAKATQPLTLSVTPVLLQEPTACVAPVALTVPTSADPQPTPAP